MDHPIKLSRGFGKDLRQRRQRAGISLRKFAERVGIHPTYLSKIELGQLPPPRWQKLITISRELKWQDLWITVACQVADQIEESGIEEDLRFLKMSLESIVRQLTNLKPKMRTHLELVAQIINLSRQLADEIEDEGWQSTREPNGGRLKRGAQNREG